MGKLESNKLQKRTSLLNTAFNLFTTKGVSKTSIAEISKNAGIAKGTFYLYFKDKYDIRNKLVSYKTKELFYQAYQSVLEHEISGFDNQLHFMVDFILDSLEQDYALLVFISKNLSWGVFQAALDDKMPDSDQQFYQQYLELIKKDGLAKRGRLHTVHGVIETPVFMNVGTAAAIKGAVATSDLQEIKTQVELSNTYHLHVRPGDEVVKKLGGLHKFMNWDKPILTDSGGFQVFSLAGLRRIKEEGVYFNSHIDGRKIFMGPEESMQIQSNLASTIAMAFDECPSSVADRDYMEKSVARTTRWLVRCKKEMERLNALPDTINKHQMLFGINQGGVYEDIRIKHADEISKLDLASNIRSWRSFDTSAS